MGTPKTIIAFKPEDVPELPREVIGTLDVERFCSRHKLGPGLEWSVYHTLCRGRIWSVAVRFIEDGKGECSEYLLSPDPTCLAAIPRWRQQIRDMSAVVH